MANKIDFLNGVVFGIAVALLATLYAYGYIWSWDGVKIWLKEWQTLIGSVVAVLAAIAAISAVGLQVKQIDQHKTEDLLRVCPERSCWFA